MRLRSRPCRQLLSSYGDNYLKQHMVHMSLNVHVRRETARVLRISPDTVLCVLREKEGTVGSVNTALLRTVTPDEMIVDIQQVWRSRDGCNVEFCRQPRESTWAKEGYKDDLRAGEQRECTKWCKPPKRPGMRHIPGPYPRTCIGMSRLPTVTVIGVTTEEK